METITLQRVREVMSEVVTEYGRDHVQSACINSIGNSPVCIAAHVMARTMTVEQWATITERPAVSTSTSCVVGGANVDEVKSKLRQRGCWPFTVAASSYLMWAQNFADNGGDDNKPWGDAYDDAERQAEDLIAAL